jgi:uncharacterized membrane protein SirB2
MNSPDAVDLKVSDIRMYFDTLSVGVTIQIPMEMLENNQSDLASLSLIAKLIKIIPHLRDTVLDHKKLAEIMRTPIIPRDHFKEGK